MDRASRALSIAEDHSAAIDGLNDKIAKNAKTLAAVGAESGGKVSFGTIASYGGGVVVAFDGESCELTFCGETVAVGASPILAVLPSGKGELALSAARANARALVLRAVK